MFYKALQPSKNQKITLAHSFHLCHSDEGKFWKIKINNMWNAISCPSPESIPQKAFAEWVKFGDTLNIT